MKERPWQIHGMPEPKSEASRGEISLIDYEIYSGIIVSEEVFYVRLDGWRFHSLTRKLRLEKPYDEFFANSMVRTGKTLFLPFNPVLGYVFSDEINLLFDDSSIFGRVEKIDSVLSGLASTTFTQCLGERYEKVPSLAFDCRVIPVGERKVVAYLAWRQAEAFRDCHNSYAQQILLRQGLSPRETAARLKGLKISQLRELMKEHGVDPEKIPHWHQRGILLHWEKYEKTGYDPIEKKEAIAKRRRVVEDWNPPRFDKDSGERQTKKLWREARRHKRKPKEDD